MAYSQGTATSFLDLYNKLRDFLTTDSTLVGLSEEWTQIAGTMGTLTLTDEITMEGPGLAGTDAIRIKFLPVYDVPSGRYNIQMMGVPNYNASLAQNAQLNMSNPVYVSLWNGSMPYTFVASGRRFIFVAQVSSIVQAGYGGFFLPNALPSEYPYPLCVGGSSNQSGYLYSQTNVDHCHFVNPSNSLQVFTAGNVWIPVVNFTGTGAYAWSNGTGAQTSPYAPWPASSYFQAKWALLRECFGGSYPIHPVAIMTPVPTIATLGELDGCYHIPGISNSHGNTFTISSEDYMVVQNVSRVDNWLGYWALKLG